MPSILFVHENYPAQFGALADWLAGRGWEVVCATAAAPIVARGKTTVTGAGVRIVPYKRRRDPRDKMHPYLQGTERAVLNGQAAVRVAAALKQAGFSPDIIVAHSGWGSGSLLRVVWPDARYVPYLEWWYGYPPVDGEGDPGENPDRHASTLCRNLPMLLDLEGADAVLVPTAFQAAQLPGWARDMARVIHDGVDTELHRPALANDLPFAWEGLPDDAQIVTYATRGMEPTRGFPQFMAALAEVLAWRPDVHAVIAGTDTIHYGAKLPEGDSWKARALAAHDFDPARLHFTGRLPRDDYARLLRRSDAHAYLTRPFVPSWSLMEAMATGCPLVVSDCAPVREALPEPDMALAVDMDRPGAIAEALLDCLDSPSDARARGARARTRALAAYDRAVLFPEREAFLRAVIGSARGGATAVDAPCPTRDAAMPR